MAGALIALAVAFATPLAGCGAAGATQTGLPGGWIRGVNLTAYWHTTYGTHGAAKALSGAVRDGTDAVAIWVTWYQRGLGSTRISRDAKRTPSDASIRTIVARAKRRGLHILLRPIVDVADGAWRGEIRPSDTSAWFDSYRSFIEHYAGLARSLRIDAMAVGCEFKALTGPENDGRWRAIVADVRGRFPGSLTYSANWDEYDHIGWWDVLDTIGIDAYFPLSVRGTPPVDALVRRWSSMVDEHGVTHHWQQEIAAVQERFGKPVEFTEVGWRSVRGAARGDPSPPFRYSGAEQVRAFEAFFRAWRDVPWFRGAYIWQWTPDGRTGHGNTDHSPQGKPAERVISGWYHGVRGGSAS